MRITLTLEDRVVRDLQQIAHRSGKSFNAVFNETLQAGLEAARRNSSGKRDRIRAMSLGGVRRGVDLDKALSLADTLEDQELLQKME